MKNLLAILSLVAVSASAQDVFRLHFKSIVGDAPDALPVLLRLAEAEPELILAAQSGDAERIREELTRSATRLWSEDYERQQNRRTPDGKVLPPGPLPPLFGDRVVAVLLVSSMPEFDGDDVVLQIGPKFKSPFYSQVSRLIRVDPQKLGRELTFPGSIRSIAEAWCRNTRSGSQGQITLPLAIRSEFPKTSLQLARRMLAEPDDSDFWIRPGAGVPDFRLRETVLRSAVSAVAKWGDARDIPAIQQLLAEQPAGLPNGPRPRSSTLDTALGVLVELTGQNPADYQMRVTRSSYSVSYTFRRTEARDAAYEKFESWWDFLEHGVEPGAAPASLDEAIENLLADDFPDKTAKAAALALVESDLNAALPELLAARPRSDSVLARLDGKIVDAIEAGELEIDLAAAEARFEEVAGETDFFGGMLETEKGLIAALSGFLESPEDHEGFLRTTFLRRATTLESDFQNLTRELSRNRIARAAGKPYPPELSDETFASLTALLFVQSQASEIIPTPALESQLNLLVSGLNAGVYKTKSPVLEEIRVGEARGRALEACLEAACLASSDATAVRNAFQVSMRYRMADLSRQLARRVLEPDFDFGDDRNKDTLLQYAAHSFMSFGKPAEDLEIASKLLDIDRKVRLGGRPSKQERKHIEIREFGLMAIHRMIGRDPEALTDGRITGYCPVNRFVKLDIIKDPERWAEVRAEVDSWIAEFEEKSAPES